MPEILQYAASGKLTVTAGEFAVVACLGYDVATDPVSKVAQTMRATAHTYESIAAFLTANSFQFEEGMTAEEQVMAAAEMLVNIASIAQKNVEETEMAAKEKPEQGDVTVALCESLKIPADSTKENILIAVEKLKIGTANEEVKTLRERLDAAERRLSEKDVAEKTARIKGKIDEHCRSNRINKNSPDALSSAEKLYQLSEAEADTFFNSLAPSIPTGRVQSTTKSGTGNSREHMIAASAREWSGMSGTKSTKKAWVNESLRESGFAILTEDEAQKV